MAIRAARRVNVPPPPHARGAPTLWQQLPPPNRQQLVWLLSHLLERHLGAARQAPDRAPEAGDDR